MAEPLTQPGAIPAPERVQRINFDASRIEYPYPDDKGRFGEANQEFCLALNSGERFSIAFTSPLYEDKIGNIETGSPASPSNGDIYYAVAVLGDGKRMPYPLVEEAADRMFKQAEVQAYWKAVEVGQEPDRVEATKDEFDRWAKSTFGDQFAGIVEAYSGDTEDRNKALVDATELAKKAKS